MENVMVKEHLRIGNFVHDDIKHVLLCGDKGYIKYCGLTMTSMLISNPEANFEIHLVCDDIDKKDYKKLEETSGRFNVNINIYKLNSDIISSLIGSVNKNLHISVATFFRLVAFNLLHEVTEKLLYMDSDIMVVGDISEFWKCNLSDREYAVVVKDVLEGYHKQRIKVNKYFNAGIVFVDLKKWNNSNFTNICIENIKKYHYEYMDQDALNVVLQGKCTFLHKEYDFICDLGEEIDKVTKPSMADIIPNDVRIIHFCGRSKPWCSWVRDFRIVKKYMEMLKSSSWSDTPVYTVADCNDKRFRYKYAHMAAKAAFKEGRYFEGIRYYNCYLMYKVQYMLVQ